MERIDETFRYYRHCIVAFERFKGKESTKSVVKGDFSGGIEEDLLEGGELYGRDCRH